MHNHHLLALLFALLWSWSLMTANSLGGFIHVPLVAAFVCASLGRSRIGARRAASATTQAVGPT